MSIDIDYENPWQYNGLGFLLLGRILGIILVLFISSQTYKTDGNILVESIFGHSENRQEKNEE